MRRYIVQSSKGFRDMRERIRKHKKVATDSEFHPGRWVKKPGLVAWQFTVKEQNEYHSWYVPLDHRPNPEETYKNFPLGEFLDGIKPVFEDASITKICHPVEVESGMAIEYGMEFGDNVDCTQAQAWLYEENKDYEGGLGLKLKHITGKVLGRRIEKMKDLMPDETPKSRDVALLPISSGAIYGTNDSLHTYMLDEWFKPKLAEQGLLDDYYKIEIPLIRVLREMVRTGIVIDMPLATEMHDAVLHRKKEIEQEAFKIAGEEFNINSRQQLGRILFDKLGYPPQGMTDGGKKGKPQYKTGDDVMQTLAAMGLPLAESIRDFGDLTKLDGTYIFKLLEEAMERDGLYLPDFRQYGTLTGRFTSDFQQVPRPPEKGTKPLALFSPLMKRMVEIIIRKLITCREDEWLIVADQNQLELRLLAHYSQDEALVGVYSRGEDMHEGTAQEIRDAAKKAAKSGQKNLNWIFSTQEMKFGEGDTVIDPRRYANFPRQDAKPINFGLVYGLIESTFKEMFGTVLGPIVFKALSIRFGGMMAYRAAFIHQAHLDEEIRTLFYRKRRIPDINHENWKVASHAERQIFNTLIQGSAADLMKLAQIVCFRKVPEARQCLQVHDELVFRFKGTLKQARECAKEIKHIMENVVKLKNTPLRVDPGIGRNWLEAKG